MKLWTMKFKCLASPKQPHKFPHVSTKKDDWLCSRTRSVDAARPRIVPRLPWPPFSPNFGANWKQQTSKSFKSLEGFFLDVEISVGKSYPKTSKSMGSYPKRKQHVKQTNKQRAPWIWYEKSMSKFEKPRWDLIRYSIFQGFGVGRLAHQVPKQWPSNEWSKPWLFSW